MSISDPRLFDHDPLTGVTEYFHYDPDTEGFTIETRQDVESLLDANKEMFNDASTQPFGKFGDWKHVASIPAVILMELAKQGICTTGGTVLDEPRFKRWLNDRDNRFLRTFPGRV